MASFSFSGGLFALTLLCFAMGIRAQGSQNNTDNSCLLTDDECQCSITKTPGQCMRAQGDGTCLMGACNEGYRCDCFGFEICKRTACSVYTTTANAIPSDTVPFQCQLTPNARKCTTFNAFVPTVSGASNAQTEASTNNDEAFELELGTSSAISKQEEYKLQVTNMLKELEPHSDKMTEKERDDIEKDAQLTLDAMEEAKAEAVITAQESAEVFKANRESSKFKALAIEFQKKIEEKEKEEAEERKKPISKFTCLPCVAIRLDITRITQQRTAAVIASGTWAQKGRTHLARSLESRLRIDAIELRAKEASTRVVTRGRSLLSRFLSK